MTAEKFSTMELAALRNELVENGFDTRQAGEVLQIFLMGRGYGVSPEAAIDAAARVEGAGCSIAVIERELQSLALVQ
jgi:hypothetical protein